MKKTFFLLAAIMILSTAYSQSNFSGSWTLNSSKSTLNEDWSMAPKSVIIAQADNELKLEKHASYQGNDYTINDEFTLDGKECINKGWRDSQKKSTAVWGVDMKELTITSKLPMRDNGELTIVEVYQLSDGDLVVETSVSSSYGDRTEKFVFDKQ
ncbi:hypothetical protein ACUNWD_12555 [Sunxiuqinia sp. A32]|uniref:hypothetical protein n=1 Tax=Sunxiuqinia sp. A32 TaxID=3461496 RepID=UPI004046316E